jgi:transmembrane sensor
VRLQEHTAEPAVFLEWQRWLGAAVENREAYEQIEDAILRTNIPRVPPLPDAQALASDRYDGSVSIAAWRAQQNPEPRAEQPRRLRSRVFALAPAVDGLAGKPRRVRSRTFALAAAVAGLAVVVGGLWLHSAHESQHAARGYQTAAGERRSVTLPEGSKVTLDADSALDVQLSPQRRSLTLARGEAYFEVAKDPNRPFTVHAGNTVIRAVGTAFNVRVGDERTVVAVTEGRVEVLPARPAARSRLPELSRQLRAGEAVAYEGDDHIDTLSATEASIATTWLVGPRQYRSEPLRYVLADIDRYTGRRITIADAATGNLEFTGTLNLENSDAWLEGLAVALPVTIREEPDGAIVIALRNAATP